MLILFVGTYSPQAADIIGVESLYCTYVCSGEPGQRLQLDPAGPVVGPGDDDDGGLRGHGAQDLFGHVCWCPVCHGRGPGGRPPRPRHCLKLRHVLLTHSGIRYSSTYIYPRNKLCTMYIPLYIQVRYFYA